MLQNGQTYFKKLAVFTTKVWPFFNIMNEIVKLNKDLIAEFIAENFDSSIDKGQFPSELIKHADLSQLINTKITALKQFTYH